MRGASKIKSILVMVIMLLVGVLGFLGVKTVQTYFAGASADTEPKNVLAKSGEDGKTATVTWTSDKPIVGIVEYGTTPASLLLRAPESDQTTSHSVVLSPLKPNVNYYFRIRVGEEVFDNNGIPYSFKTKNVEVVVPTLVPTLVPTAAVSTGSGDCRQGVDYNKDGVANTLDYIACLKGKPTTKPGPCDGKVDFDKNGVINSLDRLKCLQSL